MQTTNTRLDLIQFIYDELPKEESQSLKTELLIDNEFSNEYHLLSEVKNSMEVCQYKIRPSVVQNLIDKIK